MWLPTPSYNLLNKFLVVGKILNKFLIFLLSSLRYVICFVFSCRPNAATQDELLPLPSSTFYFPITFLSFCRTVISNEREQRIFLPFLFWCFSTYTTYYLLLIFYLLWTKPLLNSPQYDCLSFNQYFPLTIQFAAYLHEQKTLPHYQRLLIY